MDTVPDPTVYRLGGGIQTSKSAIKINLLNAVLGKYILNVHCPFKQEQLHLAQRLENQTYADMEESCPPPGNLLEMCRYQYSQQSFIRKL